MFPGHRKAAALLLFILHCNTAGCLFLLVFREKIIGHDEIYEGCKSKQIFRRCPIAQKPPGIDREEKISFFRLTKG